jgi:hypothetical protein
MIKDFYGKPDVFLIQRADLTLSIFRNGKPLEGGNGWIEPVETFETEEEILEKFCYAIGRLYIGGYRKASEIEATSFI